MVLCGWLLHEKEHEVEDKTICLNSDKTREKKHDKNYNQGFMYRWYFVSKIVLTYCEKKMF